MLMGFGTREMGTQALVKLIQADKPAANRFQGCSDRLRCGMLWMLQCDTKSLVLSGAEAPSPVSGAVSNPSLRHW